MQKIEKWRVEELSLMLDQLAEILKRGDNCEWANVFYHFHHEAKVIISSEKFDLSKLKKLLTNIKNCFSGISSLNNIVLWHENPEEKVRINQELQQTRVRLLKILAQMKDQTQEYIS
ncbi:MAG: hypothetical protein ACETWK_02660 [Candidatus Aminicenantaceae bacterium]